MQFEIIGNRFYRDKRPIKLLSGAVHYFRNLPDTWDDIFEKMRALGLNTVETYTTWNLHEPKPGIYRFDGNLDVAAFIRKAAEHGLMVIVRPGPYICAEFEFGGLPWWLQAEEDLSIRCMNAAYIAHLDRYLDRLFAELRPLLATNGGPIIMMQCENEYGYYGDDKEYLCYLAEGYKKRGIDVPLFTSDGASRGELLDGHIDGCLATLNFGSQVEARLAVHDELFPNQPKMCMELWNGWFDAWGDEAHHKTSAKDYAKTVSDMLRRGSLNLYMFIGGTNFGFTNGAIYHKNTYAPDVTSYDYDALLTEWGDVTEKYHRVREVLAEYAGAPLPQIPKNRKKLAYGRVALNQCAGLMENLDLLSAPIHTDVPLCMEKYGIGYGYILYTTVLHRDYTDAPLSFEGIGDRAHIYVEDRLQGILYTNDDPLTVRIHAKAGERLRILVENMGRANFGPRMMQKKGLFGRVLLDKKLHFSWDVYPLPMDRLDRLVFTDHNDTAPCFYKGTLQITEIADTFLSLDSFTKGFVTVNGFHLGRFWEIGPQKRLYVPASVLKLGENEVLVFESDRKKGEASVIFTNAPDLG